MKLCWLVICYQRFQIFTNDVPVNTLSYLERCNLHQLISSSLLPFFLSLSLSLSHTFFHQLSHMLTRLSVYYLPACLAFLYPLLL